MKFQKYHGIGNDFVLAELGMFAGEDEKHEVRAPDASLLERLCDRHRGVGADGLILVGPLTDDGARMIIFNRDGSRPEMCGNGVRCVVAMLADAGVLVPGDAITILSDAGPRPCVLVRGQVGCWEVAVDMGEALIGEKRAAIEVCGERLDWMDVDMGNPHAVMFMRPAIEVIDAIGAELNGGHEAFPHGVNAEFVVDTGDALDVVVYERGVGRTQACGTGACAVAAAAWRQGIRDVEDGPVVVKLPGGPLEIEVRAGHVWMAGPAKHVFTGALASAAIDVSVDGSAGE